MRQRRPFKVHIEGIPGAGKSTLIDQLIPLFKKKKIWAVGVSKDSPRAEAATFFAAQLVMGARKKARSLIHQGLLLMLDEKARHSLHDVVLVEQGPDFMYIMERAIARTPTKYLMWYMKSVQGPDLVIYLVTTPGQARKRGATNLLRKEKLLCRIYAKFQATARRKKWTCIETEGRAPDEIALEAYKIILAAYEQHLKAPTPRKKFRR